MKDSTIESHHYRLRSRHASSLNARSERREFEGALIRLDGIGVGCIHPWPELGDSTLDEELAALADGRPLALGARALECAAVDGEARRMGRWLFEGLRIPRSHWTARQGDVPADIAAQGFDAVKLKLGVHLEVDRELIEAWASEDQITRLRLDFNEALSADLLVQLCHQLSKNARDKIEFIEDPFPFHVGDWSAVQGQTGMNLAVDRMAGSAAGRWPGVIVIKPAALPAATVRAWAQRHPSRMVFTSYMDHAIGQCWAAYLAAACNGGETAVAGLLTHECFESDEFFSALGREGNVLCPPRGSGLGFDAQLQHLSWTPLT